MVTPVSHCLIAATALATGVLLQDPVVAEDAKRLQALGYALIYLFLLVLVFLVGSFIIWRSSRRFRELLQHRPPPPTPTADVWSMHKLPEGAIESIPEDPTQDPDEDEDEPR